MPHSIIAQAVPARQVPLSKNYSRGRRSAPRSARVASSQTSRTAIPSATLHVVVAMADRAERMHPEVSPSLQVIGRPFLSLEEARTWASRELPPAHRWVALPLIDPADFAYLSER